MTKGTQTLLAVESRRLDSILLFGNVQLTTQSIGELLKNNIDLSLLSLRGKLKGRLTPPLSKNNLLRIKQYELSSDDKFILNQALLIIKVKVDNSLEVLKRADWDSTDRELDDHRKRLKEFSQKVKETSNIEALRGIEGSSAKIYFSALSKLFKANEIEFEGRKRRPPPDPVNAILSLGYTLLGIRTQSLLEAVGFDPYIGFLHKLSYGRPSLALDLLEPYRAPVVDRLAVKLFNLKILKRDDFIDEGEKGIRMTQPSLKRFLQEWEKHLNRCGFSEHLKKQVESLANVLKGEREFPIHYKYQAR